jgi:DNA invertase Pin-like site-specific DNA recombinase
MDRQLTEREKFDVVIEEYASGRIPFAQREGGARVIQLIDKAIRDKDFKMELHVHSLERLGRNLKDLSNVISMCSDAGVGIVCQAQGIRTILPSGEPCITSQFLAGILASLAQFEAETIRIRTQEGQALCRAQGRYTGRKKGSVVPPEKFLKRPKVVKALEYLNQGLKAKDVSKLVGLHANTISKVKRIYQSEKRKGNIK